MTSERLNEQYWQVGAWRGNCVSYSYWRGVTAERALELAAAQLAAFCSQYERLTVREA